MNNKNLSPQFELPKPQSVSPEVPAPTEADPADAQASEQRNMELPAAQAPAPPAQADPATAAAALPGTDPIASLIPDLAASAPTVAVTDDALADDGDLIEKEWIQKAKSIVERTRNDPYHQNLEINKVKKDYIQKRYNKNVKLIDE
ncbi:MAG: hypothetical protein QG553_819 [Patescibacteria group bacterium]|nr:hypothetical protein [Patescibacteria group bacterium]